MRRVARAVGVCLGWFVALLGAVFAGVSVWIQETFGQISVDQMLTNLYGGGEGVPDEYISGFIVQVVLLPAVAIIGLYCAGSLALRRMRCSARSYEAASKKPAPSRRAVSWARGLSAAGIMVLGAVLFAQTIGLSGYIRSLTTDLSLDTYYVAPQAHLDREPLNLVVIYLESMENAFGDESVVEKNVFEPLQQSTEGWASMDELLQYDGGGWTMAGIVGTQCGVPLRGTETVAAGEHNDISAEAGQYMPGAICLGDVLSEAGYTNVFMGGADAAFASKGAFLRTHGFDEVLDLPYWHSEGDASENEWGISDGTLFAHARDEIDRLHETGQPFNLTMLTLDSHEAIYLQSYCDVDTEVYMTSVAQCSMQQVADFVDHLDSRGYLDDTVVVLMGDHEKLVSAKSDYAEFAALPHRTIFNRVWSPESVDFTRNTMDQLSMYPTMLDLLGFSFEGQRAGVGVSAFLPAWQRAGILDLNPSQYQEVVESRSSELYTKLWGRAADAEFVDPTSPG